MKPVHEKISSNLREKESEISAKMIVPWNSVVNGVNIPVRRLVINQVSSRLIDGLNRAIK